MSRSDNGAGMDRRRFYSTLRGGAMFASFTQRQVDAIEPLLDEAIGLSLPHAAHVLAEVYHETGGGMYPIKETVMPWHKDQNPSDAEVIRRLNRAWSAGQLPGVRSPYWREGWFGRGGIQITHEENYVLLGPIVGANLVGNPSLALDPVISARVAVRGCEGGHFRKKKLSDFDRAGGGFAHAAARSIVNGDMRKNGAKVAGHAEAFEAALAAAGW